MKADSATENHRPLFKTYKEMMNRIEFMENYIQDPEIFNPESTNFRNFLIQSFCFLYSDFHYLSFLKKEDIDLEIVRAASILQIIPASAKKIVKLFDSMTKDEIHKFWLKFFALFSRQNDFSTNSLYSISWEDKINFFKDITGTLSYLNYEFPVVNIKKFNCVDINKEMASWTEQVVGTTPDEMTSFSNDDEQTIEVDIEKVIKGLKQVLSMYSNLKFVYQHNKSEHAEFFINFIHLTKSILKYMKDFATMNCTVLDEFNCDMFSTDQNLSENLVFLKRCNNLANMLKSNIKELY